MGERPIIVVIPARLGSTRMPEKVLADATGWPLVQHVHEAASQSERVSRVVVATDDARVARAVEAFGGEAVMTGREHASGTSRIVEAARTLRLPDDSIVVNVQGDEPELDPAFVGASVDAMLETGAAVGTVALPLESEEEAVEPSVVKAVVRLDGRALYFSRSCVPAAVEGRASRLRHVGIYSFRRPFLEEYARMTPTPLERAERLEQLRIMEHGHDIAVARCEGTHAGGIDTPAQYEAFVARWRSRRGR